MVSDDIPSAGYVFKRASYEFACRIHCVKIYPLPISTGLTALLYGHENGLRVIWRRLTQCQEDRDEIELTLASALHTVNVYLGGAEALSIAVPNLPANFDHNTNSIPPLLSERMVIGVTCSDFSIRVVSLPCTPTECNAAAGQVTMLAGEPKHESIPSCISMTFAPRQLLKDADLEMDDADNAAKRRVPRSMSGSSHRANAQKIADWDFLIASVSSDLSGRLIIHRVRCNKSGLENSTECGRPWSVCRLASPAVSVSFSSAFYPSPYHPRLLLAEARGVVRIKDYISKVPHGSWLGSLYADFSFLTETASSKPKHILDCCWLCGGKAIIVLLSSGEWGVWDVENAGPQMTEAALHLRTSAVGINFVVSGWVNSKTTNTSTIFEEPKSDASKFAPLTPSTRKIRQAALFAPETKQLRAFPSGGISVIPSTTTSSSRADDESILIWYGTTIITMSSFISFWQKKVRGAGNLFSTDPNSEFKNISDVQFNGEICNEISLNPSSTSLEIVIAAGRRLFIIASPDAQKREPPKHLQLNRNTTSPDDQLLAEGDLDLFGMDRVLNGMSKVHSLNEISTARNGQMIKAR